MRRQSIVRVTILSLFLCISVLHATAYIASAALDKRGDSGKAMTSASSPNAISNSNSVRLLSSDINPISFDDIMQGRFVPVPVKETHIAHILEGDQHPDTLLFADPPKASWAPIIDLTYPRPFRSLNALMQRYKHLHIYRHPVHPYSDSFDSVVVLLRRPPNPYGVVTAAGSRIVGLNERIREIEYIRHRYGANVAWARFHKTFTPIENAGIDATRASKTWAEIVASPFVASFGANPLDLRLHLDHYRMAKFLSLDGRHLLGIRVNPQGVADHYEQEVVDAFTHV